MLISIASLLRNFWWCFKNICKALTFISDGVYNPNTAITGKMLVGAFAIYWMVFNFFNTVCIMDWNWALLKEGTISFGSLLYRAVIIEVARALIKIPNSNYYVTISLFQSLIHTVKKSRWCYAPTTRHHYNQCIYILN